MKNLLLFAIFCIAIASSCGPRQASYSQLILGKWDISSVKIDGEQQINDSFVNSEGWIKFHTNHTFDSDGKPYGSLDGDWEIINEDETLTLTANQNLSQASKWDITFDDKAMTWTNQALNITIQLSKSSIKS